MRSRAELTPDWTIERPKRGEFYWFTTGDGFGPGLWRAGWIDTILWPWAVVIGGALRSSEPARFYPPPAPPP